MSIPDVLQTIVRVGEPLSDHTWFRLGGPAKYFAKPTGLDDLRQVLHWASGEGLATRVLSGGSNLLVGDAGVDDLVIHLESPAFADVKITGTRVQAGAAVPLTALISQTARAGLAGLEILTGIPGTVGAAVKGNAGGRQGVIGGHVRHAAVIDADAEIRTREHDELGFSYRSSNIDDAIILSVELELEPEDPESVVRRMRRLWIVKKERQPYGHQSCGCIFKNPTPELSAAHLIEQSGLKNAQVGGAEVSDRHANFIIAHHGATADDVLKLIDLVREKVAARSGYRMDLQIQIW